MEKSYQIRINRKQLDSFKKRYNLSSDRQAMKYIEKASINLVQNWLKEEGKKQ